MNILRQSLSLLLITVGFSLLNTAAIAASETHGNITLGMSASFTGPSKGLGIELLRGSNAYLKLINKNGGINGKKIEIKYYDDGYNPVPAIRNTIRLVQEDNVLCLFNYVGTPTVTRVLPLIKHFNQERSVYMFFPFSGAEPQREYPYNHFVFNIRASYRQETEGLISKLYEAGYKRMAIFYQADAYGRSGWDGVRRTLAEKGLTLTAAATYRRGAEFKESMQKQVEILGAGNPDAIICIGAYAACAAFIRDARNYGLDIPICNLSFVGSENLLSLLNSIKGLDEKDYTSRLINTQVVPSYEDTSLSAVVEYRKAINNSDDLIPHEYLKDYEPLKYSFVSFEGFINAKVMCEILKRMARTDKPDGIYTTTLSVHNLDIGIDTPVIFKNGRHQGLNKVYFTTVEGNKFIPIKDWKEWKK